MDHPTAGYVGNQFNRYPSYKSGPESDNSDDEDKRNFSDSESEIEDSPPEHDKPFKMADQHK